MNIATLFRIILFFTLTAIQAIGVNSWAEPLHDAAASNDLILANELVLKGVSIDSRDEKGRSALYWATLKGHMPMIEFLVKNGADINYVSANEENWTPLIVAAYQGDTDITDYFIAQGSLIDAKDTNGYTPLSWAWTNNNGNTIQLLIKRGADVNVPVAQYHDVEVKPIVLLIHDSVTNQTKGRYIELLLDNGADINARSVNGGTPLHFAVDQGNLEGVMTLVDNGADLNAKVSGKVTVFKRRSVKNIPCLNCTPLKLAKLYNKYYPNTSWKPIVQYLKARGGFDPDAGIETDTDSDWFDE